MNNIFSVQNTLWQPPQFLLKFSTRLMNKLFSLHANILLVSLLVILLSLTACSSSGLKGIVEPPTIQVHKVEMGNFNLSGGNATFILDIHNPNRFSIPMSGFNYGLRLNGVEVAKGAKENRITIRGGQSYKMSVPLSFSFTNMIEMLPGLLRKRQLNYDLGGSIHLPWFNIPFNRTGSANLR